MCTKMFTFFGTSSFVCPSNHVFFNLVLGVFVGFPLELIPFPTMRFWNTAISKRKVSNIWQILIFWTDKIWASQRVHLLRAAARRVSPRSVRTVLQSGWSTRWSRSYGSAASYQPSVLSKETQWKASRQKRITKDTYHFVRHFWRPSCEAAKAPMRKM